MKKFCLILLFTSFILNAHEVIELDEEVPAYEVSDPKLKEEIEQANVVQLKITFYRDPKKHDEAAWEAIKAYAVQTMVAGSEAQEGTEVQFVEQLSTNILRQYKRCNGRKGVFGEITMGLGNGECNCGGGCECGEKYKGMCPCSALGSSCGKQTPSGDGCSTCGK